MSSSLQLSTYDGKTTDFKKKKAKKKKRDEKISNRYAEREKIDLMDEYNVWVFLWLRTLN